MQQILKEEQEYPLYRYVSPKHLQSTILGTVSVGSLEYYRREFEGGSQETLRVDAMEGIVEAVVDNFQTGPDGPTEEQKNNLQFFEGTSTRSLFEQGNISVHGIKFQKVMPNLHIICLSHKPNVGSFFKMGLTEVFEINDVKQFATCVHQSSGGRLGMGFGRPVNYTDKTAALKEAGNIKQSPFSKPWRFAEQDEYRLVFQKGVEPAPDHFLVHDLAIGHLIRHHSSARDV